MQPIRRVVSRLLLQPRALEPLSRLRPKLALRDGAGVVATRRFASSTAAPAATSPATGSSSDSGAASSPSQLSKAASDIPKAPQKRSWWRVVAKLVVGGVVVAVAYQYYSEEYGWDRSASTSSIPLKPKLVVVGTGWYVCARFAAFSNSNHCCQPKNVG
jgi:hypothetical protein